MIAALPTPPSMIHARSLDGRLLYSTKVAHRVVSALAFAVDFFLDEAKIRGRGKSMPNLYRKVLRRIAVN